MALQNKLGAVALALVDKMIEGVDDLAPTAVAALISIRGREPLTIGDIAALSGLTHSAAVRLVDRLEKDWLVRRKRRVGREVLVEMTARGKRRAQQLQEARSSAILGFIETLDADDRRDLDRLAMKLVAAQAAAGVPVERLCRMCKPQDCDCGLHDEEPA